MSDPECEARLAMLREEMRLVQEQIDELGIVHESESEVESAFGTPMGSNISLPQLSNASLPDDFPTDSPPKGKDSGRTSQMLHSPPQKKRHGSSIGEKLKTVLKSSDPNLANEKKCLRKDSMNFKPGSSEFTEDSAQCNNSDGPGPAFNSNLSSAVSSRLPSGDLAGMLHSSGGLQFRGECRWSEGESVVIFVKIYRCWCPGRVLKITRGTNGAPRLHILFSYTRKGVRKRARATLPADSQSIRKARSISLATKAPPPTPQDTKAAMNRMLVREGGGKLVCKLDDIMEAEASDEGAMPGTMETEGGKIKSPPTGTGTGFDPSSGDYSGLGFGGKTLLQIPGGPKPTPKTRLSSTGNFSLESNAERYAAMRARGAPGKSKKRRKYKILVVGNSKCGKTSIINRYVRGNFTDDYRYTIGCDYSSKEIKDEQTGLVTRLQLWDIAGQDRFIQMNRPFFRNAKGAIVVCDVSRTSSIDAACLWKAELNKCLAPDKIGYKVPTILIANKVDKLKDIHESFVIGAYVQKTALKMGFDGWFIGSAKRNEKIDEAVEFLIKEVAKEQDKNDDATAMGERQHSGPSVAFNSASRILLSGNLGEMAEEDKSNCRII